MTPEEKFNQVIWWVLEEIRKEGLATNKDNDIRLEYQTSNDSISVKDQERALRLLQKEGAIKNLRRLYPKPFELSIVAEAAGIKPTGCFLEILQPKFKKVYSYYKNKCGQEENLTQDNERSVGGWFNHKNNSITFHGDIYKPRRESQLKFILQLRMRYQTESNSGTILKEGERILETIISNKINVPVKELRDIKKQFNRSFKYKGFPLKIDSNAEGILLIYTI